VISLQRYYDEILRYADLDNKRAVVMILRNLYNKGLITPRSGNVSFVSNNVDVMKKYGKVIWITPKGKPKILVTEQDLVPVTIDGIPLSDLVPSTELPMHLLCYQRTNAKALVHAHSPYTLLAAELEVLTDDNLKEYYETKYLIGSSVTIIERYEPGSEELAVRVSEALSKSNIAVLLGHGVVAKGENPWVALDRVEVLEMLSKILILKELFKSLSSTYMGPSHSSL